MSRINFAHVDQAPVADVLPIQGVSSAGHIQSRAVITESNRPINVWHHELAPAAELSLDQPIFGHGFYVLRGSLETDGEIVDAGGVVMAEHRCRTTLRAGAEGASLVHFTRPDAHPERPRRAGGHVHFVGKHGILRTGTLQDTNLDDSAGYSGTLWANSECPTCELWLHKSDLVGPVPQEGSLHAHSADEIIYILDGEMLMGQRRLPAGTAMAIDGDTRYRVGVGPSGLSFLNFRAQSSFVRMFEQTNTDPIDERELWRAAPVL
jgi:hypothetical protein